MQTKEIAIVCFLWDNPNFRSQYTERNVEVLLNMVQRSWGIKEAQDPVFYCITDKKRKFSTHGIKQIVLDMEPFKDFANLGSWPVLQLFNSEIQKQIKAKYILKLDLDLVILRDLKDLVCKEYKEGYLTGWLDPTHQILNCGFMFFKNGDFQEYWRNFLELKATVNRLIEMGLADKYGWDQCWINYLENSRPIGFTRFKYLTKEEGLFHRREIEERNNFPKLARVVFFPSSHKPWGEKMQSRHSWIKKFYL